MRDRRTAVLLYLHLGKRNTETIKACAEIRELPVWTGSGGRVRTTWSALLRRVPFGAGCSIVRAQTCAVLGAVDADRPVPGANVEGIVAVLAVGGVDVLGLVADPIVVSVRVLRVVVAVCGRQ